MTRDAKTGSRATDSAAGVPAVNKKHFDTFETTFFAQGEASDSKAAETEQWSDLDEGRGRRFAPSRQRVVALAIGSTCLAAIGCVALWRSGGRPRHAAPVAAAQPASSSTVVVAVAPAEAPVVAPPAHPKTEPAVPAAVPTAAIAEPTTVPVPGAVAVAATAEPTIVPAAVAPARAVPVAPPAGLGEQASGARETCMQAVRKKQAKDILSACARAFEADPALAEAAVAVARVEFERGHAAQALAWARKAIAVDPAAADAYVFVGGAEQNAGHGKAAKEAYRRYLQLAPGGRYAADLRAILGNL